MLYYINFYETLIISYSYLLIYNLSLIIFFFICFQFQQNNFKTLFSFNNIKFNFFSLFTITILLFSIAGIPPFLGFFSKLLILNILIKSYFFIFFIFFILLLLFGLYLYLQNIKFLYSINKGKINYIYQLNLKIDIIFIVFIFLILNFLIFGFFFLDEILFYFYWLFN